MKIKRLLALFLALLLILPGAVHSAEATGKRAAQNYNIVIVTDCSTSLVEGNRSDPDSYRFEAISMFLGLLPESGNNVSAIVFGGTNSTTDNSDKSMRSGLKLNTELLPMDSKEDKQDLVEQIRAVPTRGYTDIGTALLAAAEKLDGMTAKNGLKSIIVLFTDGYTETADKKKNPGASLEELPVYAKSLENGDKAVELIKKNDITLCGVYLQGNSSDSENSEVLDLVRRANDLPDTASASQIEELYIPVKEAASLQEAYRRFFTVISGTEAETFTGEKEFVIPGMGVTDINLQVSVTDVSLKKAQKQLDQVSVSIVRPDMTEVDTKTMSRIQYKGKNFMIFKLNDPEAGVWRVRVDGPEGVKLESSLMINADVSASMSLPGEAEGLRIKEPMEVFAQLYHKGQCLPDAEAYRQYECFLEVYRDDDPQVKKIPLIYQADRNGFLYRVMVENYGIYYARVVFQCGSAVRVVTETEIWDFRNEVPDAPRVQEVPVTLSLLSKGVARVDLAALVQDEETIPAENITVNYGRYDASACSREGNILTIDGAIGGSGSIYVTYLDMGGAETMTELKIVYTDNSVREMMFVGLALVVMYLLWMLLRWLYRKSMKLEGSLEVELPLVEHSCALRFSAQEAMGCNLKSLLRRHRYELTVQARLADYTEADIDAFMKSYRRVLSRIRFSAVRDRSTGIKQCRVIGAGSRRSVDTLADQGYVSVELEGRWLPMRVIYLRFS